jgi:predicted MFS family arabinose efflux permease
MAASGIGSTLAALWVAFQRRPGTRPIAFGAIALGLGSVVLALSTSFPLSLAAMAVAGAGGISMAVTANTTIQLAVPDHLRGRVMSFYTTIFSASVPAGGLLMGAIASAGGVPLSLFLGAILTLAVGVVGWVWLGRIRIAQRIAGERNRAERVAAVAAADIGVIDPEGRSAGTVTGARPR